MRKKYPKYFIEAAVDGTVTEPLKPSVTVKVDPKFLSLLHHSIIHLAMKRKVSKDVEAWTTWDIVKWKFPKLGDPKYIHEFKRQWVKGYRDVINAAAKQYALPPVLVGGVAYTEVGGDPSWIDDVARGVRKLDRYLPFKDITKDANKTSFGDVSMQIRVAVKELGYDPAKLSDQQASLIIDSLKKPRQNIFIAAKHLAHLRDIDFKGKTASTMTKDEIVVTATRYNRGPKKSLEEIKSDLSYGKSILKRYDMFLKLLGN